MPPRLTLIAALLVAGAMPAAADSATDAGTDAAFPAPPPSAYDLMLQRQGGKPPEEAVGGSFVSQGLRTLVVLAVVIALAYLSLRLLRRFMGKGLLKGSGEEMTVLARTYIEPRRTLLLVKVGRRFFLIGSAEQGMILLAELTAEDAAAACGEAAVGGLSQAFSRVLADKQGASDPTGADGEERH